MQITINAQPYTLCINCPDTLAQGATVVRLPDGIEASCNEVGGLWLILEALGGRSWWQCNRPRVIQQVLGDCPGA
jgi:hypothetical protein